VLDFYFCERSEKMTITGIKIEFEGQVDTVEDRKEPYLVSRMPVGSPFKGSFQFYDTRDL
jgi:hypothetical protein